MRKFKRFLAQNLSIIVILVVCGSIAAFIASGKRAEDGSITLDGSKAVIEEATKDFIKEAQIAYAKEVKKAKISINGKEEELDVPTVENIDSSKSTKDENSEVGGRGWAVDTGSIEAFRQATIGKCIDTDGAYGSQCWDLGNLFWRNYAGRSLNTCGTGAAKGTIGNGCWQRNAGSEFDMVWDRNQIRAGDWVIFGGGQWGHIGMALGGNNGGFVALLGTNQGGVVCAGGGSATNIINMSLGQFIGAFRPKKFATQTPSPAPKPNVAQSNPAPVRSNPAPVIRKNPTTASNQAIVRRGDTLGDIAIRNGWAGGQKLFGNDGFTEALARKNGISNRGLIFPGQVINR